MEWIITVSTIARAKGRRWEGNALPSLPRSRRMPHCIMGITAAVHSKILSTWSVNGSIAIFSLPYKPRSTGNPLCRLTDDRSRRDDCNPIARVRTFKRYSMKRTLVFEYWNVYFRVDQVFSRYMYCSFPKEMLTHCS